MKDKGLGINFGDMIDTDTGMLVVDEPVTTTPEEEVKAPTQTKEEEGLIEVNVEEEEIEIESTTVEDAQIEPSSSLPYFKVLAKALYEKGVLSDVDTSKLDDLEGDEAELLIDMIKGEIDKNVSGYKESLPDTIKSLIDNYEDNVPLDKLIGLRSEQIRLDNITEDQLAESEDLQKKVIIDMYKRQGMSDARIKRRVQQFDDLGQLLDESKEALSEGKEMLSNEEKAEIEKAKNNSKKAETDRKNNLKSLKDDIFSTSSLVEGIDITDREKELIYESMTKPVEVDQNGTPMNAVMVTRSKNPIGFEKLLHYYHSLGLFNLSDDGTPSPDISKIKTGAKASAMDELNSVLKTRQKNSSGEPARSKTVDNDRMRANIEAMKKVFS